MLRRKNGERERFLRVFYDDDDDDDDDGDSDDVPVSPRRNTAMFRRRQRKSVDRRVER